MLNIDGFVHCARLLPAVVSPRGVPRTQKLRWEPNGALFLSDPIFKPEFSFARCTCWQDFYLPSFCHTRQRDRQTDRRRQTNRQTEKQTDTHRQSDTQTQTVRQTDRQTDIHTHTNRRTDRQVDKQAHRQTEFNRTKQVFSVGEAK